MKRFALLCVACMAAVAFISPKAEAIAPFKKAFQQKYVDTTDNDGFKQAYKKTSCNACHVKGEKKTVRNAYGDELAKIIEGNANERIRAAGKEGGSDGRKAETEKVLKELDVVFGKVEKVKAPSGQTYGEMLKNDELPPPPAK